MTDPFAWRSLSEGHFILTGNPYKPLGVVFCAFHSLTQIPDRNKIRAGLKREPDVEIALVDEVPQLACAARTYTRSGPSPLSRISFQPTQVGFALRVRARRDFNRRRSLRKPLRADSGSLFLPAANPEDPREANHDVSSLARPD
jgi:hypothetical protein